MFRVWWCTCSRKTGESCLCVIDLGRCVEGIITLRWNMSGNCAKECSHWLWGWGDSRPFAKMGDVGRSEGVLLHHHICVIIHRHLRLIKCLSIAFRCKQFTWLWWTNKVSDVGMEGWGGGWDRGGGSARKMEGSYGSWKIFGRQVDAARCPVLCRS